MAKSKPKSKKSAKIAIKKKKRLSSGYDLLGSWTGTYLLGEGEEPVQDVDDL